MTRLLIPSAMATNEEDEFAAFVAALAPTAKALAKGCFASTKWPLPKSGVNLLKEAAGWAEVADASGGKVEMDVTTVDLHLLALLPAYPEPTADLNSANWGDAWAAWAVCLVHHVESGRGAEEEWGAAAVLSLVLSFCMSHPALRPEAAHDTCQKADPAVLGLVKAAQALLNMWALQESGTEIDKVGGYGESVLVLPQKLPFISS